MHLSIFQSQKNSTYAPDIWHSLTQIIFPAEHEDSSEYLQRSMKSFYFNFTEEQLIHNAVLITAVQQSDSVIHTCMLLHFFFIMVYHKILNIAPCGMQRTLVFIYPIYRSLHLLVPNPQSFPPHPPSPLAPTSLLSIPVSLFLISTQVHLCHVLDSKNK